MPRTRPDDFKKLHRYGGDRGPVWARWWRHRDGSVTHVHYSNDGTEVVSVFRRDRECSLFERKAA